MAEENKKQFVARFGEIEPYDYQQEIHQLTIEHIRNSREPAYIYASVSAGKSISMAMIAKHAQDMASHLGTEQMRVLCIARTGELVEQNSDEFWKARARNSIFSASVGLKSTKYPVIVGSEGSVCRSLHKELADFVPGILAIDECHQVDIANPDSQYMKIISELTRRNPKLRVIGYTGSPWRGTDPIKGQFWKRELYRIDMWELVKRGKVEPPIFGFGHDDVQYDLSGIDPSGKDGNEDFSRKDLDEMQKRILDSGTVTEKIMLEVMGIMQDRNCALITCAGKKHMEECAAVLPAGTFEMITDKTGFKKRREIKRLANEGQIKYVLQIGCWTVGVNIPPLDTIVILRRIGSLTLLTQLIGRGVRKLKPEHEKLGMTKKDCAVLDYAGTMESIGHLFYDPIMEEAEYERAKQKNEIINCPRCEHPNSKFARRCIGEDASEPDNRCGFFWQSKRCPECETENDVVARECRHCDKQLKDPNENLSGKHYTDADLKEVLRMDIGLTKNRKGIVVRYQMPDDEVAVEVFYPNSEKTILRKLWFKEFVSKHLHKSWHSQVRGKPATAIVGMKAIFDTPTHATHRINEKGRSVLHRKVFRSGRVEDR